MLGRQVGLSGGDSLVLLLRCDKVEIARRNHFTNVLYFGDSFDTLKREAMRNDNKEMLCMREFAVDGQPLVDNVRIFRFKAAISLKVTALVAYPVHTVPMSFMYSFWWSLI